MSGADSKMVTGDVGVKWSRGKAFLEPSDVPFGSGALTPWLCVYSGGLCWPPSPHLLPLAASSSCLYCKPVSLLTLPA